MEPIRIWSRALRSVAVAGVCVGSGVVAAQAAAAEPRPWRIGVLFWHDSPNDARALAGVRQAFLARGRPHELTVRSAEEDRERAREILRDFATQDYDLVMPLGTQASLLAREFLDDTPIVYTAVTNPVESGVVDSWQGAGPGTGVAGNSNWIAPETLLHVFRQAVPALQRLGVLRSRSSGVVSAAEVRELRRWLREAPGERSLEVDEAVVDAPEELDAATARLLERGADAIWIPIDFTVYENLDHVAPHARAAGVPLVSSSLRAMRRAAVAGVLVDYEMLGERAVVIALEVLEHGRDPGSIPVGRMRGYQVVVNLGAARRSGYELPLPLIVVADRVLTGSDDGELPPDLGQEPQRDDR